MCLNYSKDDTEQLIKSCKRSGKTYIICYKIVLKYSPGVISSPFQTCYEWNGGWNYATEETYSHSHNKREMLSCRLDPTNSYISDNNTIHKGLHVYRYKKDAVNDGLFDDRIIKVKCYIKDMLGASTTGFCGTKSIVFRKVWVDKKELEKIT